MTATQRSLTISIPAILAATVFVLGQVPAGVPFDGGKHPNPIVTWVNEKDFRKMSFLEAGVRVGVEVMSLSRDAGERTNVEVAMPSSARQKLRYVGEEFEVTFYPVMRQTYKLKSGKAFQIYTFKFPRALTSADVLNMAMRPSRGSVPRFGSLNVPERIEVRDAPGLFFDDGKRRTVYWFELGAGYTVTTEADRDELFEVLDDLL